MAEPSPGTQTIDTWSDGYQAWRSLLQTTEHALWVLDHDLSGLHLDRADGPDFLLSCLHRLAPGRIRIMVRDETPLLMRMPRTRQHLVDYGHIAEIRKIAMHHASSLQQSIVLSDDRHVLLRPRFDAPRAFLRIDDPADSGRHQPMIQDLWDAATPISLGTVLGL